MKPKIPLLVTHAPPFLKPILKTCYNLVQHFFVMIYTTRLVHEHTAASDGVKSLWGLKSDNQDGHCSSSETTP